MSLLATQDLLGFALHKMFAVDHGYSMVLDIYSGDLPTKAELEGSNIYTDDNSGWIDPVKWQAFLGAQSIEVIRRFALTDFSKNTLLNDTVVSFNFGSRPKSDYYKEAHTNNIFGSGNASWFAIRGFTADFSVQHYAFTGVVSDFAGNGELKLAKVNIGENDLIFPSSVSIDVGNLLVM